MYCYRHVAFYFFFFFFSSRRRHTRLQGDWSSDVCSSDLPSSADDRLSRSLLRRYLQRQGVDTEVFGNGPASGKRWDAITSSPPSASTTKATTIKKTTRITRCPPFYSYSPRWDARG